MQNKVLLMDVVDGLKQYEDNSIDCIILDPSGIASIKGIFSIASAAY